MTQSCVLPIDHGTQSQQHRQWMRARVNHKARRGVASRCRSLLTARTEIMQPSFMRASMAVAWVLTTSDAVVEAVDLAWCSDRCACWLGLAVSLFDTRGFSSSSSCSLDSEGLCARRPAREFERYGCQCKCARTSPECSHLCRVCAVDHSCGAKVVGVTCGGSFCFLQRGYGTSKTVKAQLRCAYAARVQRWRGCRVRDMTAELLSAEQFADAVHGAVCAVHAQVREFGFQRYMFRNSGAVFYRCCSCRAGRLGT